MKRKVVQEEIKHAIGHYRTIMKYRLKYLRTKDKRVIYIYPHIFLHTTKCLQINNYLIPIIEFF